MYDIVFEKAKGRGGTVNGTSVYVEAATRRVLYKRCFEKFRKIREKTSVPESLLRCFRVNFVEFVRTPFLQSSNGRLIMITAVKYKR